MDNENSSEIAKQDRSLRRILTAQDIIDGNFGTVPNDSAITPYEADAAVSGAGQKYTAADQLMIDTMRQTVSNLDLTAFQNVTDLVTNLDASSSVIKEFLSNPYLNGRPQVPYRFSADHFPAPLLVDPIEEVFEPLPNGGIECFKFYATGGTAVQAGTVLSDEFSALKMPLCYLEQHQTSIYHWHICIYQGDTAEARELHLANQSGKDYPAYLDKTERIGYVYISDRPKIQVVFYVFDETHKDNAISMGHAAANELEQSGFDLSSPVMDEGSLPEGATILDDFENVLFGTTTYELANLASAYLQVEGHVVDSVSLKRKIYEGQICIQYSYADCIIRLKTNTEKMGETNVKPDVYCWETNPIEREKKLTNARKHIVDLIEAIKNKIRWIPQKPKSLDDWDAWFEYLHECEKAGINYDLKMLAEDISKSHGYVRQRHSEYLAGKES